MAKVLLISSSPPRLVAGEKVEASHYRAWQFLHAMLTDGHEVRLCACVPKEDDPARTSTSRAAATSLGLAGWDPIAIGTAGWVTTLQRSHDEFQPDCVVAVAYEPCLAATRLRTDRPLWMDIYGDQITIQQSYCRRMSSDQGMPTTIGFMAAILRSGDVFSVCGQLQKHLTVGELAMCGRLNHRSFGYEFVRVILPGSPDAGSLADDGGSRHAVRSQLGLEAGDCAVLWCGGYNTWTDVETLFTGIDAAMEGNPSLHYVSAGGSTYEAPVTAYERLLQLVEGSRHAARYHMLGWRPWRDVAPLYRACQVGLNIDATHYETLYGTRTRLVEMIAAGLPVMTTEGTELSILLERSGAALTFPPGDHAALSRCVLRLAADAELQRQMANAAEGTARGALAFEVTTVPLRDWLRVPRPASDRNERGVRGERIALRHRLRGLARLATWRVTARPG